MPLIYSTSQAGLKAGKAIGLRKSAARSLSKDTVAGGNLKVLVSKDTVAQFTKQDEAKMDDNQVHVCLIDNYFASISGAKQCRWFYWGLANRVYWVNNDMKTDKVNIVKVR